MRVNESSPDEPPGVELLYICGIVRHLGTFSFGDYRMDCDMSATLRDIGATFSAITETL